MNGRYIIFADDDADDLELITGFFKQYNRNTNVLEFRDGKEVIKFLDDFAGSTSNPLLIVLDVNMPRMNGRETLESIRGNPEFRSIPVVMYTTAISNADEVFYSALDASWMFKSSTLDGVRQTAKIFADFCEVHK